MSLRIRNETVDDYRAIDEIHQSAFEQDPHSRHDEQFIVRALRASGDLAISLVAELDGTVVGHIAISPVSIDDGTLGWYGLGPVAVRPTHQGMGIGHRLVRDALDRLPALGAAGCVVLGEPALYGRFGFEPATTLVLPGVPASYFQAVRFAGPTPRGRVCYHDSFGTNE